MPPEPNVDFTSVASPSARRRQRTARSRWMVLAVSLLGLATPSPASAEPGVREPQRIVFPTGEWPADVENVQAAADIGGTVLLKATDATGQPEAFNFGVVDDSVCDRQVALEGDVSLRGESVAGNRTTIRGGYRPILVGMTGGWCDPGQAISPVAGDVRIEGIVFDGFYQAAIDIYKARNTQILKKDLRAPYWEGRSRNVN